MYNKSKKAGVAQNPRAELEAAYKNGDYTALIAASVGLLAEEGKDAEVELNKAIKEKVKAL